MTPALCVDGTASPRGEEEPVSGNDLRFGGCGEFDLPAEHPRDIMAGLEG